MEGSESSFPLIVTEGCTTAQRYVQQVLEGLAEVEVADFSFPLGAPDLSPVEHDCAGYVGSEYHTFAQSSADP
mgnify:CR=1 FL=1